MAGGLSEGFLLSQRLVPSLRESEREREGAKERERDVQAFMFYESGVKSDAMKPSPLKMMDRGSKINTVEEFAQG